MLSARDVGGVERFECSECGLTIELTGFYVHLGERTGKALIRICPNCGKWVASPPECIDRIRNRQKAGKT